MEPHVRTDMTFRAGTSYPSKQIVRISRTNGYARRQAPARSQSSRVKGSASEQMRATGTYPRPPKGGEGGEHRRCEPGEGLSRECGSPLTRLASLGTLSPLTR